MLLILLIVVTILFFEVEKTMKLVRISAERSEQLAEKQKKVTEYREQIEFYNTNEGMAHLGREQYNFIFPGERIFVISYDKNRD